GGHAKVIIETLRLENKLIYGFFDDKQNKMQDLKYLGKINELNSWADSKKKIYKFIVAIGDCVVRKKIIKKLNMPSEQYGIAVHPSAIVAKEISIGYGTVIFANAVINPDAVIGEHAIINTGSIVEHDCRINNYVHLSPGVCLAGGVHVGVGTQIGIGSQCIQMKKIGSWCMIGAGSTIVKDIPSHSLAYGNPAKIKKEGINFEF
ncbi:TPA: acetyltransferase, partial [Enterococcus faecium]|nr:acetyltransferase [Enterococcus faecium]HAP8463901.1 acetyltransferase [Enterococcus faecium]HAR1036419.1 acetyltransferase [Enterococcus faecium]HBC2409956.1 acetyltransferase [Enterococcus faecium]HBT4444757.1 acetyltransferase [Enterococcus faecium]